MTAWQFDSRILCSNIWSTGYWRYVKAPSMGAHAGCLVYPPQQQLFGCIWKWDCHLVPWWHWTAPFPLVFYLLSRLSQKVSNFCLHTVSISINILYQSTSVLCQVSGELALPLLPSAQIWNSRARDKAWYEQAGSKEMSQMMIGSICWWTLHGRWFMRMEFDQATRWYRGYWIPEPWIQCMWVIFCAMYFVKIICDYPS